jgi:hypothetical protein
MYCLRREVYTTAWDAATKLPKWERIEVRLGAKEAEKDTL